jgi:hypothetical protein
MSKSYENQLNNWVNKEKSGDCETKNCSAFCTANQSTNTNLKN